jgi:hypothetical protein
MVSVLSVVVACGEPPLAPAADASIFYGGPARSTINNRDRERERESQSIVNRRQSNRQYTACRWLQANNAASAVPFSASIASTIAPHHARRRDTTHDSLLGPEAICPAATAAAATATTTTTARTAPTRQSCSSHASASIPQRCKPESESGPPDTA